LYFANILTCISFYKLNLIIFQNKLILKIKNDFSLFLNLNILSNYHYYWYCLLNEYCLYSIDFRYTCAHSVLHFCYCGSWFCITIVLCAITILLCFYIRSRAYRPISCGAFLSIHYRLQYIVFSVVENLNRKYWYPRLNKTKIYNRIEE